MCEHVTVRCCAELLGNTANDLYVSAFAAGCQCLHDQVLAERVAAATDSNAGSSNFTACSKRKADAAAGTGQLLESVGGDEDVHLMAEMGAAEAGRPRKQQKMTDFVWSKKVQQDFHRDWTKACVADGDSFNSVSLNSAKGSVIQQYFGATLPDRKKMAGPCLDAAAEAAAKERNTTLGKVNGFAVAFDGGKDRNMGGGSKMISLAALLPNGKAVYLDTVNTEDCYLDAET
jgi:hypothetical protein